MPARPTFNATSLQGCCSVMTPSSLTPSQFHIWKSQAISSDKPLFNQIMTVELTSYNFDDADQDIMLEAWDVTRKQYPVLDTTLTINAEGLPVQNFGIAQSVMEIVRLPLSRESAAQELDAWVRARGGVSFSLDTCLCDAALIHWGEDRVTIYLNIHHLIIDAWSMNLVFRSLLTHFKRLKTGDIHKTTLSLIHI